MSDVSNNPLDGIAPDRRRFLGAMAGLAVGATTASTLAAVETPSGKAKRSLRLAHITDIHVFDKRDAEKGMAACLHHAQNQKDKPEMILFGGDLVMDTLASTLPYAKTQWECWHRVLKADNSLPFEPCIGNHDIWGWFKGGSKAKGDEAEFGKQMALDQLKLAKRYRSFTRAGWKFIILDSTQHSEKPNTYLAKIDDEQFTWLQAELKETPATTPILVMSHIPILSGAAFYWNGFGTYQAEKTGDWVVYGWLMHHDSRKIIDLFSKHPNVKVCLSGHLHMVDRVDYLGVTYWCNGAVCGAAWKGKVQQFSEGYAMLDLFDDGSATCDYVPYGWKPVPEK